MEILAEIIGGIIEFVVHRKESGGIFVFITHIILVLCRVSIRNVIKSKMIYL